MISILLVSICLSIPSEWPSNSPSVTGTSVEPSFRTLPSARYGPSPLPPSKSMYCSPAADKPATRPLVVPEILVDEFSLTSASTPLGVRNKLVTLPIGTPRRVTSWFLSRPPDAGSSTMAV